MTQSKINQGIYWICDVPRKTRPTTSNQISEASVQNQKRKKNTETIHLFTKCLHQEFLNDQALPSGNNCLVMEKTMF